MISRIENGSGGKYLYIQAEADENGFESKMASSVISENIIAPTQMFAYGGICLEYCITGLKNLEEYLSGTILKSRDLTRLLAQTEQSVNTVKNYLLSETDLLINADYVYVDEQSGLLKLCIVPGYNGDFEQELKGFINKLLMHIDAKDAHTLKLGFRLFKTVSSGDFKLHDVTAALRDYSPGKAGSNEAYGNMPFDAGISPVLPSDYSRRSANGEIRGNAAGSIDSPYRVTAGDSPQGLNPETEAGYQGTPFSSDIQTDYRETKTPAANPYNDMCASDLKPRYERQEADYNGFDETAEAPDKPRSIFRETLSGFMISQGILIAVAIVVFLLKGRSLVMRLIPIYLIIAACVAVYYAASFVLKRRQSD